VDAIRLAWTGDDPAEASAAVARLRAGPGSTLVQPPRVPRHDDRLDAAAAQARGLPPSRRADAVAYALSLLAGEPGMPHGELTEAMERAGLEPARAEREVVRLLATDRLVEPRPGRYRLLA
jgi:hypothetical protein